MHMQDVLAAEFGSLPLPESISFENDPGFELELDPRPCASLEPGDGPALLASAQPLKLPSCEVDQRNASMPTCTDDGKDQAWHFGMFDDWSFVPSPVMPLTRQRVAEHKSASFDSWYQAKTISNCCLN